MQRPSYARATKENPAEPLAGENNPEQESKHTRQRSSSTSLTTTVQFTTREGRSSTLTDFQSLGLGDSQDEPRPVSPRPSSGGGEEQKQKSGAAGDLSGSAPSLPSSSRKPAYARATKENSSALASPAMTPPVARAAGGPPPIPSRTSGSRGSDRRLSTSTSPDVRVPLVAIPPRLHVTMMADSAVDDLSDSLGGSPPKFLPSAPSLVDSFVEDELPPSSLPPAPVSGPSMEVTIKSTEMVSEGGVSIKKVQLFVMEVRNTHDGVVLDAWLVCRRYNAFHSLWQDLQAQTSKTLPFPSKKFKLTLDESESEHRIRLLQKFLNEILHLPHLAGSTSFGRFIDPLEKPSMFGLQLLDIVVQSALYIWTELPFNQHEWHLRHVVLVSGKIIWFKGANSLDCSGHMAADYCSCDARDEMEVIDGKSTFVFEVKHLLHPKPQLFATPSAMERSNWVKAIRQARAQVSGGTIGASANDYAIGDERPILGQSLSSLSSSSSSSASSLTTSMGTSTTKSATLLKGYAAGQLRLSTFSNVPDTLSSVMGTFSFGADSDTPDQIIFKRPGPGEAPAPDTPPLLSRQSSAVVVPGSGKPIQGATFRKLIEKLTTTEYFTPTFVAHFLLTYRISSTAQEVLSYLLARYHHSGLQASTTSRNRNAVLARNPVQDRVCQVFEIWLDTCYGEFVDDPDLTQRLLAFVFRDLEGNILMHEHAQKIKSAIKIKVEEGGLAPMEPRTPPPPLLPKMVTGALDILDIDPVEVARQMTLLDHDVFSRIQPAELLGQKWTKNRHEAPNVLAMIARFNSVAAWVTRTVLSFPEPALRSVVFSHFLRIAHNLSSFHSWGSMCAIMGGLVSPPISRLKKTLAQVSDSDMEFLHALERIIDPAKNHSHYRKALELCQPPCVPYLGLYLADLTFIEDGNPSYVAAPGSAEDTSGERLINWEKRRMLGKVLAEVRKFQSLRYAFHPIPALQFFLSTETVPLSDKDAYELSLKLEPREASH